MTLLTKPTIFVPAIFCLSTGNNCVVRGTDGTNKSSRSMGVDYVTVASVSEALSFMDANPMAATEQWPGMRAQFEQAAQVAA